MVVVMIYRLTTIVLAFVLVIASVYGSDPNSFGQDAALTDDPNNFASEAVEDKIDINPVNELCGNVLNEEYISDSGHVDYAFLRRKRSDLYKVTAQFRSLEVEKYLEWSNDEQVAFWINVHNIYTLELIVNNYPIEPSRFRLIFYPAKSIMQISGARDKNYFGVMGREYSLEEMQKNILELYGDPRILFALSYAAKGTAPLRNEPYNAPMLEQQLDNQVRRFLGRRTGFYIDKSTVYLSPIFDWHSDLFIEYYGTDVRYRSHNEKARAMFNFIEQFKGISWSRILESDKFRLKFDRFDWQLNGE
jgi:hypothetical protein